MELVSASSSSSYRCPTCESTSKNPRNLAVFIDGTSNKPGDKNTNVVKLYQNVIAGGLKDSDLEQRTYYLKGIGAYDVDHLPTGKAIYSGLEMAIAMNVEKNIKDAYRWLSGLYRKGDQIYMFGFSRGAYQVRALASVIHEVGLVRERENTDSAYTHYLAIDPYKPRSREKATEFKRMHCWHGVRIHFVGVWDTVSSLGLIKRDVHITASASVTNACHFRHALALDERRVKFMPEYFLEMNAQRGRTGSPRTAVSDVKEIWFAGAHSDVGGTERPSNNGMPAYPEDEDNAPYSVHAGNIPLLWMRREAADKGLVFKSKEFAWDPEDIDFGTRDTMSFVWKIAEILPFRHQVSFSGTGKHERRPHLFCPRSILPGQQIHTSVLSGDLYSPRAALGRGICIPTVPQNAPEGLWATELPDEEATRHLLSSVLSDKRTTLECLEKVLFLLDSRLANGQIPSIPQPRWSEKDIPEGPGFANFALTVIYDITSKFTASEGLVISAKKSLRAILSTPDHPEFHRTLYTLRLSAKHQKLGQRFICDDEVIGALMLALEWTAKSSTEHLFSLVTDTLCCLISNNDLRGKVVEQLSAMSNGTEAAQSRLSMALEVKSPSQLVASLKMIASLAQFQPAPCKELKPKICELAKKRNDLAGSTAVQVLVALKVPPTHDIHICNILGYLGNILPRLDAEGGSAPSADNIDSLPSVLLINGSGPLDEEVMGKLVSIIKSRNARERTAATLTLLKLCGNSMVRKFCSEHKVLDIFMRQLKQREASLLAAYALKVCLKYKMWGRSDFTCAAKLVVAMLDKGWFDDAVGQVEGLEIFRGLMASADLRQQVEQPELDIVGTLVKKLEVGNHHEVRMSLSCLDILGKENPLRLTQIVGDSVRHLADKDKKVQMKGIKILTALAQTAAGEEAIKPRVIEIVKMLLPSPDGLSVPRSRLFGPTAVVYGLCKNETLRKQIKSSQEFDKVKSHLQPRGTLRPSKA